MIKRKGIDIEDFVIGMVVGILVGWSITSAYLKCPTTHPPQKIMYEVTAYCPESCCTGRFADGITASGHVIRQGDILIAANLPFGTMITIPGYGRAPVLDRGGSITEGRLDVLFHSHEAAREWGRQTLLCEVEM